MQLSNYIERHLLKYIKQHLHDGYTKAAIKHALLSKGHHTNLIDRAILYLEKNGYRQNIRQKNPRKQNLDDDMFKYMVGILSKYIKQQQHDGYRLHDIRTALLNFGHSYDVIDHSIDVVSGKEPKKREVKVVEVKRKEHDWGRYAFSISALIVFGSMVLMSILSDTSFVKIAIAFMPAIFSLFAIEGLFSINQRWYSLAVPPLFCLALKLANDNGLIPALQKMAFNNIIGANLLIAYAVVFVYYVFKK